MDLGGHPASATEPVEVVTPMKRPGRAVGGTDCLVPILRAGLGMGEGVLSLLPQAGSVISGSSGTINAPASPLLFQSHSSADYQFLSSIRAATEGRRRGGDGTEAVGAVASLMCWWRSRRCREVPRSIPM